MSVEVCVDQQDHALETKRTLILIVVDLYLHCGRRCYRSNLPQYILINHHKTAKTEYFLLYKLVNSYVLNEISNVGLPRHMLAMAKNGWFQRDWVKDTADVCGSVSQCHAPTAVHTDITARRTGTQIMKN